MNSLTVTGDRTPIPIADILYLKADNNYTWFYLKNGQVKLASLTLSVYASKAPELIRIHKSFLVNPDYIHNLYKPTKRIAGNVELTTGAMLTIAYSRWGSIEPFLSKGPQLCKLRTVS